ncbi:flagellar motor stator protein MotA [Pyrinomonas methylaliphatogenes]|jgi:chemotaxis protein MotA|uniref:Flagellar motor stator protein MotA n=1 Tax=Pyrinomonas methylaliphatogenes TaxID=454194 RepID=A0A0B6WZC4_9BACT|nr:flagellar motor stator protein MotA [Pyrinomonas methylaliphatogenes]CDM65634.1 flagellar motor stator protein MotA [Pyrinomonas methylaliphatogenes]
MFVIIGIVIVLSSVIGGYLLVNGPLVVLFQPSELLIIGGAALGSIITSTPPKTLALMAKKIPAALKGSPYSKEAFAELLRLQYEIYVNAKKNGMLSLEEDVNSPATSSIFSKYPSFLANHHAVEFFCDALKLLVNGAAQSEELELAMEAEIETHHEENSLVPSILMRTADSMPGLGIVAAVLGIVVTMQHLDGPPEELGHHIAAALVGTFLGLLLCYGIVAPLANNINNLAHEEARYFACIKAGLVAFANGAAPITAVEFARKTIYSFVRPPSAEIETQLREIKPR